VLKLAVIYITKHDVETMEATLEDGYEIWNISKGD